MKLYLNKNNYYFYILLITILTIPYIFKDDILLFTKNISNYIGFIHSNNIISDIYTQNEKYLSIKDKKELKNGIIVDDNISKLFLNSLVSKDSEDIVENNVPKIIVDFVFENEIYKIEAIFVSNTKKAKINGKYFIEGDNLPNDVKLLKINQYSIDLSYQDKFRTININNYLR